MSEKKTPYIGYDFDQLAKLPKVGKTEKCKKCGVEVEVQESDPPLLQFIQHCGSTWLVGVRGKRVVDEKVACSGEI